MNPTYPTPSRPRRPAAFTLVELMVVIVIIGILAAAVGVNVVGYIEKAKVSAAQKDISEFDSAVDLYRIDTGEYPQSLEDLIVEPAGVIGWNKDGYLKKVSEIPLDPWNNEYYYRYPGDYGKFDIYSLGADGEEGGEDADADIYNSDVRGQNQ